MLGREKDLTVILLFLLYIKRVANEDKKVEEKSEELK